MVSVLREQHVLAARRIFEEIKDSFQGKLVAIFIDFSKAFDSAKWTWIRAVLLHYNVHEELVEAVMSMYYGAKVKVKYTNDQFTNFIDLSIGWSSSRRHFRSMSNCE
jgi:membrane associated rhomboid family serine protease